MRAALRRALPLPAAVRLAALAAPLVTAVVRQLLGATALAPASRVGVLAFTLAGAAALLPAAWAAARMAGAPRVRVRPDAPDGGRPLRLGLRRRAVPAAPADAGWLPSAWTPGEAVPWTPDADRARE